MPTTRDKKIEERALQMKRSRPLYRGIRPGRGGVAALKDFKMTQAEVHQYFWIAGLKEALTLRDSGMAW